MHVNVSTPGPTWLTGMAVALVFATAPFSCSTTGQGPGQDPPIDDPDAFWVNATVEFTPVEGGCWRLTTDETSYEPVSLDQEFQEDGLPVRAALKPRPDLASICMVGQIVEVLSIRKR
ncbi:MAG: hypothetical protein ACYTA3_01730 [Planctomycetota bacterium]